MAKIIRKNGKFRAVHSRTGIPVGPRKRPVPFRKTLKEAQMDADAAACRSGFANKCPTKKKK